jgi:hypothetical protein
MAAICCRVLRQAMMRPLAQYPHPAVTARAPPPRGQRAGLPLFRVRNARALR